MVAQPRVLRRLPVHFAQDRRAGGKDDLARQNRPLRRCQVKKPLAPIQRGHRRMGAERRAKITRHKPGQGAKPFDTGKFH